MNFHMIKKVCISNTKNLELIEFNEKSLVKNFHIFKHISNSYIFVLGHDDTPIEQGIIVIKQMIESHTPQYHLSVVIFGSILK